VLGADVSAHAAFSRIDRPKDARDTAGMTPDETLDRQIELYRKMTCEQRLQIALNLHELACNLAREGIRHQFPHKTQAEVDCEVRRRLELARS
jgi:hypothetical protein